MADITANIIIYEQDAGMSPIADSPYEYKEIMVTTPTTSDTADTLDVTLATYGITDVKSIRGWAHSTQNSVIIVEDPTTSVTTGVLTVTIGGTAANNLERTYIIGGY